MAPSKKKISAICSEFRKHFQSKPPGKVFRLHSWCVPPEGGIQLDTFQESSKILCSVSREAMWEKPITFNEGFCLLCCACYWDLSIIITLCNEQNQPSENEISPDHLSRVLIWTPSCRGVLLSMNTCHPESHKSEWERRQPSSVASAKGSFLLHTESPHHTFTQVGLRVLPATASVGQQCL